MRNPLESEETAFRFLLGTLVYFGLIVVGAWIWAWLGVAVFVVATAVAIVVIRGSGGSAAREAEPPAAVADTRRILVVANETLEGERLREVVLDLAGGYAADVLLLCPLEAGDEREAARAERRLAGAVEALRSAGVSARGEVVAGDPLAALESALGTTTPDEVVVSTYAEGRSRWLETGAVDAIRERFAGPVTHVTDPPVAPPLAGD